LEANVSFSSYRPEGWASEGLEGVATEANKRWRHIVSRARNVIRVLSNTIKTEASRNDLDRFGNYVFVQRDAIDIEYQQDVECGTPNVFVNRRTVVQVSQHLLYVLSEFFEHSGLCANYTPRNVALIEGYNPRQHLRTPHDANRNAERAQPLGHVLAAGLGVLSEIAYTGIPAVVN